MKNLLDEGARRAMLGRLDGLRAETVPQWGSFDASRMLCHLSESMRLATGELHCRPRNKKAFQRFPLKHLILYVFPFPKGVPTSPELLLRASETFEGDRETLCRLVNELPERCRGGAEHPLFGILDAREWGALGHKHMDHHFRQFGI